MATMTSGAHAASTATDNTILASLRADLAETRWGTPAERLAFQVSNYQDYLEDAFGATALNEGFSKDETEHAYRVLSRLAALAA